MSSPQCITKSESISSILFAHGGDEELKNLILPILHCFPEIYNAEVGNEALRRCQTVEPCIVIAGVDQGDMTGFDLCKLIREANREVQIILVGREQGEAAYKGAMEAGAARYLLMDDTAAETLKILIHESLSLCESRRKERLEAETLRCTVDAMTKNQEKLLNLTIQRDSAFELIAMLNDGISDLEETKSLARFLLDKSAPENHTFSLRALIYSLHSTLSLQKATFGKEISVMIPDYLPDHFLGNKIAIWSVFSCMLRSAVENSDGGKITVQADMKEKNCSATAIQLKVDFNCILTPKNRFATINDYLTDCTDDAQAPKVSGLSLAATVTKRLGGEIWVKTLMKKSTTYYISLPLYESSAAFLTDSEDANKQTTTLKDETSLSDFNAVSVTKPAVRPRILLADDNEVDQLTIRRLLENMGYDVICVANGLQAIEEYDCSSFDAVFMDILMPEMDGFEATRMIREKEGLTLGVHTPIIALTSYALKAIHEKCVSVGMDSYLQKPVSAKEVAKLFSQIVAAKPTDDPVLNSMQIENLPLLDIEDTLENLDNNADLYREIMDLFKLNIESDQQELLEAINSGVLNDISHSAHKIKGMAANVGAKRYAEVARQIQDAAIIGNLGDPARWIHLISTELTHLKSVIRGVNWLENR